MGIEEFLLDQAEKKGIQKGMERGIERGIEQGMERGIKKGVEKGIEQTTREMALKMKESGLDIALIASITGFSIKEIENL